MNRRFNAPRGRKVGFAIAIITLAVGAGIAANHFAAGSSSVQAAAEPGSSQRATHWGSDTAGWLQYRYVY